MMLQSYLDRLGVSYRVLSHPPVYSAQELADREHTSGHLIAKPVIIKADGHLVMCTLPASRRVDLQELATELRARQTELVHERELAELFPDCQLGAEPPIGFLYGMPTWMDVSLAADARITFQAGTHDTAITLNMDDYRRVVQPEVGHFAKAN